MWKLIILFLIGFLSQVKTKDVQSSNSSEFTVSALQRINIQQRYGKVWSTAVLYWLI